MLCISEYCLYMVIHIYTHFWYILHLCCMFVTCLLYVWCMLGTFLVDLWYIFCCLASSLVPAGCRLGASWVPCGCHLGAFWVTLGAMWSPLGDCGGSFEYVQNSPLNSRNTKYSKFGIKYRYWLISNIYQY